MLCRIPARAQPVGQPTTARFQSTVPSISSVIDQRAAKQKEDAVWMEKLLKETEGGGYILSQAGMFAEPVTWGDHDTFDHVNNVRYLKWFETARVNLFNSLVEHYPGHGFETFMTTKGVGPIIRSVELAWRYPIRYPDQVTVLHKLEPITQPDRFILKGVVVSHKARKVAARISEVVVTVDYTKGGVKAPIPEQIAKAFNHRLELQSQH